MVVSKKANGFVGLEVKYYGEVPWLRLDVKLSYLLKI